MKARLLNTVALRYQSLYLDIDRAQIDRSAAPTPAVLIFCKFLNDCGYGAGEELLRALPLAGDDELDMLTGLLGDTLGLGLNWAALVKGWLTPTGELAVDHVLTWLANVFGEEGEGGVAVLGNAAGKEDGQGDDAACVEGYKDHVGT